MQTHIEMATPFPRTGISAVPPLRRAAQYVRMSTEHQQYSTENQRDAIAKYAAHRGLKVVATYADDGKSGLRLDGRDALKRLIDDVENGTGDFDLILVYDVSRWGRFQDADESAYYEYICKRAGVQIEYCAEQFENDGSPVSNIVKAVKRTMAGEYVRELSVKVFAGQCRLIELGYRQGGAAGFGLRRVLVDAGGNVKGELTRGEQKSIHTDRVILMPGPDAEVAVVNQIYQWFVRDGLVESVIAERLNRQGLLTDMGRQWTRGVVHQILINEKYIGHNVFNRISFKLKKKRVKNPPEAWIRADDAFDGIIDPQLFYTARGIIQERARKFSNEELLEALKSLYGQKGLLSASLINECHALPSSSIIGSRFGGLLQAYRKVGFLPTRDYRFLETNRYLRQMYPGIISDVVSNIERLGGKIVQDAPTDLLVVNGEFTVSAIIARCQTTKSESLRWNLRLDNRLEPDITVAVRMDSDNRKLRDYFLLPRIDIQQARLRVGEENPFSLDAYRFDTLDFFFDMAARVPMRR
ncbi:MAG: recombinase family protein [Rhodospirillaceae bacterium]